MTASGESCNLGMPSGMTAMSQILAFRLAQVALECIASFDTRAWCRECRLCRRRPPPHIDRQLTEKLEQDTLAGHINFAAIASLGHRVLMFAIRLSRPDEGERIIGIWREAVHATHHFLTSEDRIAIEREVCSFLPQAPLWLVADQDDRPLAFMLIDGGHMEALFVDPAFHGRGIGAALVRHGLTLHSNMTTDVNEQNDQAIGFYERMGFSRTGRSPRDGQGRPYPLIHLAYRG